jgi:hypothetical protein
MRAQGLPLNTIVLGALAVLVLVLLAAAFVPSVGNMFRSLLFIGGDPVSRCNLACIGLDWKYADTTTALTAAQSSFCDFDPGDGSECDVLITCQLRLTTGAVYQVDDDPADTCTLSAV